MEIIIEKRLKRTKKSVSWHTDVKEGSHCKPCQKPDHEGCNIWTNKICTKCNKYTCDNFFDLKNTNHCVNCVSNDIIGSSVNLNKFNITGKDVLKIMNEDINDEENEEEDNEDLNYKDIDISKEEDIEFSDDEFDNL
jgi:hypothetical protein